LWVVGPQQWHKSINIVVCWRRPFPVGSWAPMWICPSSGHPSYSGSALPSSLDDVIWRGWRNLSCTTSTIVPD
jgi:hypothetical protein